MTTYNEPDYQRQEWKAFRKEKIARARYQCENACCAWQGMALPLQVHHPRYYHGWKPWEYGFESTQVLCEPCHLLAHRNKNLREGKFSRANYFERKLANVTRQRYFAFTGEDKKKQSDDVAA